ncbi:hypothetical protein EJ04DRAFT_524912 [Polyplosphaeria fusca]|uniref:Uncharacterized protein n=1 Tax=Polyplosphaeria fusca TaxID=682080 RepID=A0A9P4V251_9PLEO|nr:hypothetical protein EJ04DRAFT_524912 [Polyplosphaeria fusca]
MVLSRFTWPTAAGTGHSTHSAAMSHSQSTHSNPQSSSYQSDKTAESIKTLRASDGATSTAGSKSMQASQTAGSIKTPTVTHPGLHAPSAPLRPTSIIEQPSLPSNTGFVGAPIAISSKMAIGTVESVYTPPLSTTFALFTPTIIESVSTTTPTIEETVTTTYFTTVESIPTTGPTAHPEAISSNAKAAIGAGVGLGTLLVIFLIAFGIWRYLDIQKERADDEESRDGGAATAERDTSPSNQDLNPQPANRHGSVISLTPSLQATAISGIDWADANHNSPSNRVSPTTGSIPVVWSPTLDVTHDSSQMETVRLDSPDTVQPPPAVHRFMSRLGEHAQ